MTSEQESHVTPPPIRYQFSRSFAGTLFNEGNAEIGIVTERPSCKSTWNFPRLGNESRFIFRLTFQYPSSVYIFITVFIQSRFLPEPRAKIVNNSKNIKELRNYFRFGRVKESEIAPFSINILGGFLSRCSLVTLDRRVRPSR